MHVKILERHRTEMRCLKYRQTVEIDCRRSLETDPFKIRVDSGDVGHRTIIAPDSSQFTVHS
jgi:hypothetical protein